MTRTMQEKMTLLATLAVGTLCTLARNDKGAEEPMLIEARVTEQEEEVCGERGARTAFEIVEPDEADDAQVLIYHDTGDSLDGRYTFEEVVHEPEGEDQPEEPKAVALNLPLGAAWLMSEANVLDREAAKYGENNGYGSTKYRIQEALKSAASALRSVVGHALAHEAGDII